MSRLLTAVPEILCRASANGLKSLAMGSSTSTLRSARNRILGRRTAPVRFQRADQSFQQIWKAIAVFPEPVQSVSRIRRRPCRTAWVARLTAISW